MPGALLSVLLLHGLHPRRDFLGKPEYRAGHAACNRFADHKKVRLQVPQAGTTAHAGGDGVGFIDDQQAAIAARQFAALLHKAVCGQDHADIGHRRFAQQRADIALRQRRLKRVDVIERDRPAIPGQVIGLADQPGTMHRGALAIAHHHVIHGAVVAAVEHQQCLALGDRPRPAHHVAVGIGGRGGHLPIRQAKALGKQLAADHCIFAGEHRGQASVGLFDHGAGNRLGRMPEHAAGIAQAKIDVFMTVHIGETCAFGLLHKQRRGH